MALKWYKPDFATEQQRSILRNLVSKGSPSDRFLWPEMVVDVEGYDGFGYLMGLRPGDYDDINLLLSGQAQTSFQALVTAGLQLAADFKALHSQGLCYRDISPNNVFWHPDNGDILIIDNDNVTPRNAEVSILGTPRFIAPELVRGEAKPSRETDIFSLGVLIFYMFMLEHPLHGKREEEIHALDGPAMEKLYGKEPVFMFDPNDTSNAPVPGYHENAIRYWNIYPKFLNNLFTRHFTDGLHDPNRRVSEYEWQNGLMRLRDSILYCPTCGVQNFYDIDQLKATRQLKPCWNDGAHQLALPPRMQYTDGGPSDPDHIVMLNRDTKLYEEHTAGQTQTAWRYNFERPVAEVAQHPSRPNVWGLRNLSDRSWTTTSPNGAQKQVDPGKTTSLVSGLEIDFGEVAVKVRS
jgi:serine/threonine protein kinase